MFRKFMKGLLKSVSSFFVFNAEFLLKAIEFLMKTSTISAKHAVSISKSDELIAAINKAIMEILKLEFYPKIVVAFMVSIIAPVTILWKLTADISEDFSNFAGTCLISIKNGILFLQSGLLRPPFSEPLVAKPIKIDTESNNGGGAARAFDFESPKVVAIEPTPLQLSLKIQAKEESTHHTTSKLFDHAPVKSAPAKAEINRSSPSGSV